MKFEHRVGKHFCVGVGVWRSTDLKCALHRLRWGHSGLRHLAEEWSPTLEWVQNNRYKTRFASSASVLGMAQQEVQSNSAAAVKLLLLLL